MLAFSLGLVGLLSILAYFWGQLRGFRYFHSFVLLCLSVYFISKISNSSSHIEDYGNFFPLFDIRFLGDAFNYLLASMVCLIGFGVSLYTFSYFQSLQKAAHFHSLLYLFTFAMLGVIFSENLLLLFSFWELTSLSSFFLIAFDSQRQKARWAATQALLVTGLGGLVMLCGFLLWGARMGTLNWLQLWEARDSWRSLPEMPYITALIMIGAFSKSAQFPFHFWLPNAMKAPTPASSFLHSATMVKAGVILLLRLSPLLKDQSIWIDALVPVGTITVLIACVMSFLESDLKKILAYTTLAALGLLFVLLGTSQSEASVGLCLLFLIVHAFYKAPLFLLLGNVESVTGHRDLNFVHGLREKLPGTFAATILSCIGLMGIFPALGFVAKELIFHNLENSPWISGVFIVAFSCFSYVGFLFILRVFGAKLWDAEADEKSFLSFLVPFMMAAVSIFIGSFLLSWFEGVFSFAQYSLGLNSTIQLDAWHGFSKSFLMSVLCWLFGLGLYEFSRRHVFEREEWLGQISRKNFSHAYDFFYDSLLKASKEIFSVFQHGKFPLYVLMVFLVAIYLLWDSMRGFPLLNFDHALNQLTLLECIAIVTISLGAVLALRCKNILYILTALGLVGFGIAFLYLIRGAPDLALTQFLVETLTLIIFLLCLKILPSEQSPISSMHLMGTSMVAALFAFYVFWITYLSSMAASRGKIRDFFGDLSLAAAHGKNVVNVIIVDFRGLDTVGEITVLVVAALGILSLLRWKAKGAA